MHFAAPYVRAASADRRETFKHDWKCVNLYNVGRYQNWGRYGDPKTISGRSL